MTAWLWALDWGWHLAPAIGVAAWLTIGMLRTLLAHARCSRDVDLARRALGEPRNRLERADVGRTVTLEGRLRVAGEPLRHPIDGSALGVLTLSASKRPFWMVPPDVPLASISRADQLWLEMGSARVQLVGPIQLTAGAQTWWLGKPLRALALSLPTPPSDANTHELDALLGSLGVVRSASDGDLLCVRGVLSAREDDAGVAPAGYRSTGSVWQLSPEAGGRAMRATGATTRPHLAHGRLLVSRATLGVVAVTLGLWCVAVRQHHHSRSLADCWDKGECQNDGRCSLVVHGLASFSCRADSSVDCAGSAGCREYGRCTPRDGACVTSSDADCAQSAQCASEGACSAQDSRCAARSNDDCAKSAVCINGGRCSARMGTCMIDPADACARGPGCTWSGECSVRNGRCTVGSDQDCVRSQACATWGRCTAIDLGSTWPNCAVASDVDCRKGDVCTYAGACHAVDGRCEALSDSDCKASPVCKEHGSCVARDRHCTGPDRPSCRASPSCESSGQCTVNGDRCVVGSDSDCKGSRLCAEKGRCSERNRECVAMDDSECQISVECATERRCFAVRGTCVEQPLDP